MHVPVILWCLHTSLFSKDKLFYTISQLKIEIVFFLAPNILYAGKALRFDLFARVLKKLSTLIGGTLAVETGSRAALVSFKRQARN